MAEPSRKATPWLTVSGRELKLAIVTALAGIYLAIWPQLEGGGAGGSASDATEAQPVDDAALVPTSPRLSDAQVTWIDQLPASERPPLVVPAGWVLADGSSPPASTAQASTQHLTTASVAPRARRAPVRVAASRARRVRTRSS